MPYRNRIIVVCFLLFSCTQLFAQKNKEAEKDVTGLWRGFMYNDTTQQNFRYEIAISESKGKLYGYSHTYFILDDKQYHGVKKLKIKREGNKIITEDDDLIVHNYPVPPAKGVHQQNKLVLEIKDTVMILSGMYTTNRTRDFHPVTGYVHVERKKDYSQSALVPHLQELNLAKNLTFLNEETVVTEPTIAILKPISTAEEEQLIAINAKKQQPDNTIKPTMAPAVITPPVAKIEAPKPVAPVTAKTVIPKVADTVVVKPITKEVVVTKPPVTKPAETVVVKPEPVKVIAPTVTVKPVAKEVVVTKAPVTKPAETVVVKPEPVKVIAATATVKPVAKEVVVVDPSAAKDAGKRKIENIQALYFKSDSLQLTLYDNGEVDGDTVSVIMNGQVIMPRVGLSTNAVKKTIYTQDAGDSIQLVMYAESLGSLPPNTGLLIVYDGGDRYEIRFSGDMQKSSAIVFRRRKN
jgi:hypothetical protein